MLKSWLVILLCLYSTLHAVDFESRSVEVLAASFRSINERGADGIWPGLRLRFPVVFHFKNGHAYAFGLKNPETLWSKQQNTHYPLLFCPSYPSSLPPLDPSYQIDGQRAFVFGLELRNDEFDLPLLTFFHEYFHLHQFAHFEKEHAGRPLGSDYQDRNQLALMELENRLLIEYMNTQDNRCLEEFMAVNQTRRQKMHPESIRWEDHQQKMEGLADYVSIKTFQTFPVIPSFNAQEVLLHMRQKKTVGMPSLLDDAMKGRHYLVGAVLAFALDNCGINWKEKIAKKNVSLQQLLAAGLASAKDFRKEKLEQAKSRHNWHEIQKFVAQLSDQERKDKEAMIAHFAGQQGITIQMGLPSGHMSAGGKHGKSCQIDSKCKILTDDVSTATSQDRTWKLDFKGIPCVMENQKGERTFKLDPSLVLQVDRKEFALKDLLQDFASKELPFSSIFFQHSFCELSSTRPGKLIVQDNMLSIAFD